MKTSNLKKIPSLRRFISNMRRLITISYSILVLILPLTAQEAQEQQKMPQATMKKVLQWMVHPDSQKRASSYKAFESYEDEDHEDFRNLLNKAQEIHITKLKQTLRNKRLNPYQELTDIDNNLKEERARIIKLMRIDYKKDPSKVKILQGEVEGLLMLNEKARKLISKNPASLEQAIIPIATGLAEIQRQLAIIDDEKPGPLNLKTDPDKALKEIYEGEIYLEIKNSLTRLRQEVIDLAAANTHNKESSWANSAQKNFALILNENRSLFGLSALKLEERLSLAATGHSTDMATLGFFAHQSPIEEKKNPKDRARLAKFQHRWLGENIYRGSSNPAAAYQAWFASDGHRFIMFADRPNLLGIGIHGRNWTMMTGRK